jgi:hypothetical protein
MLQHLTTIPPSTTDPQRSSDVPVFVLQIKYLPGMIGCLKRELINREFAMVRLNERWALDLLACA